MTNQFLYLGQSPKVPEVVEERWSVAFVSNQLHKLRRFPAPNLGDVFVRTIVERLL